MTKTNHSYEPHLAIHELSLLPGGEWLPRSTGWSLIQIERGTGYWLHAQSSTALETGTVVLAAGDGTGRIRASQLNGLSLYAFTVIPSRLSGLITLEEQKVLKQASSRRELAIQVFPSRHPAAVKLRKLCAIQNREGVWFRLALLQLFVEVFGQELRQTSPGQTQADATERLRRFLRESPPDALLEVSFSELARTTRCTPRHLSRIFHDLVGMSFREQRAEIRLARARELLATSRSKVVEVALESGFRSLSLFNLMFTRHFGTSPSRWRQKHGRNEETKNHRTSKVRRFAVC